VDRSPDQAASAQAAKNEAVLRLVRAWMADESGYDEEAWPALKTAMEEDRLSPRKC
jgi:hypothetical protein